MKKNIKESINGKMDNGYGSRERFHKTAYKY